MISRNLSVGSESRSINSATSSHEATTPSVYVLSFIAFIVPPFRKPKIRFSVLSVRFCASFRFDWYGPSGEDTPLTENDRNSEFGSVSISCRRKRIFSNSLWLFGSFSSIVAELIRKFSFTSPLSPLCCFWGLGMYFSSLIFMPSAWYVKKRIGFTVPLAITTVSLYASFLYSTRYM